MLWTHQNKVFEDIKQSINYLMTASWHVVAKLLIVSRISKVDYQNKVLPQIYLHTTFLNQWVMSQNVWPKVSDLYLNACECVYLPAIECVVLLFQIQFSLLNLYDLPGQILRFPTTKSFWK